ncbi:transcriptional regulator, partial [Geobacillus sp. MMMUD3]|nr:transcriptional regulator [Geobacillus sp. MMMUD3]
MADSPESVPVNAAVEQLLRNPEDNLDAISETAD